LKIQRKNKHTTSVSGFHEVGTRNGRFRKRRLVKITRNIRGWNVWDGEGGKKILAWVSENGVQRLVTQGALAESSNGSAIKVETWFGKNDRVIR